MSSRSSTARAPEERTYAPVPTYTISRSKLSGWAGDVRQLSQALRAARAATLRELLAEAPEAAGSAAQTLDTLAAKCDALLVEMQLAGVDTGATVHPVVEGAAASVQARPHHGSHPDTAGASAGEADEKPDLEYTADELLAMRDNERRRRIMDAQLANDTPSWIAQNEKSTSAQRAISLLYDAQRNRPTQPPDWLKKYIRPLEPGEVNPMVLLSQLGPGDETDEEVAEALADD